MKKLLLTLLIPLIAVSSVSYGEELNSLFGISLYANAEKYVSSNYIDSNKFKYNETNNEFYSLIITDKIKTKSPYASQYRIIFDNAKRVHRIYGEQDFINLDICQAVRKDILSKLEVKYQINFEYAERVYPNFETYLNAHINSLGDEYRIQCRLWHADSSSKLQIFIQSKVLINEVSEFYNTGL
jgi:hypothetical protein